MENSKKVKNIAVLFSGGYSQLNGFKIYNAGKSTLRGYNLGINLYYQKPLYQERIKWISSAGFTFQQTKTIKKTTSQTINVDYSNFSVDAHTGLQFVFFQKPSHAFSLETIGNAGYFIIDTLKDHFFYGGSAAIMELFGNYDLGVMGTYNRHQLKNNDLGSERKTNYHEISINFE
mgnify:CR=1 FL=1